MPATAPAGTRYRPDLVPYLDAPSRALDDPGVAEVYLVTASQCGKTDWLLNVLGRRAHLGPRYPALFVAPTQSLAHSVAQDRLAQLLADTPELSKVWERGHRDRVAEKVVNGMRISFAWAGSKSELASRPSGLVILDEVDRMLSDVDGEGSPVVLARARSKNYTRSKLLTATTPTIAGASPGQSLFDTGSREFWCWRCPSCAELFAPWLRNLRWPDKATPDQAAAAARYHCPNCDAQLSDEDKPGLNRTGEYARFRPVLEDQALYEPDPDPPAAGPLRSYWVLGLASPWLTFAAAARQLVAAYSTHDQDTIQAVVNTYGGELYRVAGDAPSQSEVAELRDPALPAGALPSWAQALTAGVDVQADRLYYVVRAWGAHLTSHLVQHGELLGDPSYDEVWLALHRVLSASWGGMPLARVMVDSGYKPGDRKIDDHQVYLVCRRNHPTWVPTKGRNRQSRPIATSRVDLTVQGRVVPRGVTLWLLDAPYWKTWVYQRIRWPEEAPDGRWSVHGQVDADYCAQVVAEEIITTASGRTIMRVGRHQADHYGDCEALAAAAAFSLRLDQLRPLEDRPTPTVQAVDTRRRPPPPELTRQTL